jgi:Glycosyl transferase family group 2
MRPPSTTTAHAGLLPRAITAVGLLCTAVYLAWRLIGSWHGATLAIGIPLLLVELAAFGGSLLLAWALWGGQRLVAAPSTTAGDEGVDVVVRVRHEPQHEIVASVLASRSLDHVGQVMVLVLDGARGRNDSVRALADELGTRFEMCADGDHSGVAAAAKHAGTASFLLIDAGDVPASHALTVLRRHLDDPQVAAVQAGSMTAADESLEHGPNGLHYDTFERRALNPALGMRQTAILAESGVLFRRGAIESIGPIGSLTDEPDWAIALALMNHGWAIDSHAGEPLVAHQPTRNQRSLSERNAGRIRTARHLVFGHDGALRSPSLRLPQRLSLLAWSVRPLSGVRSIVLITLLLISLIGGYVPFDFNPTVMWAAWLPGFALTSVGLAVLSGWALRPGDRARWSLRYVNDTVRSLRDPGAPPSTVELALQTGPLVVTITAITVTVVLRAISERMTGALGALPETTLSAMLLVALWTLGLALDSLSLLTRGATKRRALRRTADLLATLDDSAATVVDIGPLGAGVTTAQFHPVDSRVTLSTVLRGSAELATVTLEATVRNQRRLPDGQWRLGVEFDPPPMPVMIALVGMTVVDPVTTRLGSELISLPDAAPHEPSQQWPWRRRLGLRTAALVSVGAVAATATASSGPGLNLGLAALGCGCLLAGSVVIGVRRPKTLPEPASGAVGVAVS